MPDWINGELFKWITNNGLATVFVVLLLALVVGPLFLLLRFVLTNGIAHFDQRMDAGLVEQAAAFRVLNQTLAHLDETIDKLSNQSAANHEALSNLLLFAARTQTDVVLTQRAILEHRGTVETPPSAVSGA